MASHAGSRNSRYVNYAAERSSWTSPNGGDLRHRLDTIRIRRMAQNVAPTHEIEHQSRWKQDGGRVGRYTHGDTADSVLRYI